MRESEKETRRIESTSEQNTMEREDRRDGSGKTSGGGHIEGVNEKRRVEGSNLESANAIHAHQHSPAGGSRTMM
jgi:hypothetical protein